MPNQRRLAERRYRPRVFSLMRYWRIEIDRILYLDMSDVGPEQVDDWREILGCDIFCEYGRHLRIGHDQLVRIGVENVLVANE